MYKRKNICCNRAIHITDHVSIAFINPFSPSHCAAHVTTWRTCLVGYVRILKNAIKYYDTPSSYCCLRLRCIVLFCGLLFNKGELFCVYIAMETRGKPNNLYSTFKSADLFFRHNCHWTMCKLDFKILFAIKDAFINVSLFTLIFK